MKNFLKLEYLWKSFLLNLVFSMFLLVSSFLTRKDLFFWVSGWFFGWALYDLNELIHYLFKDLLKKRKRGGKEEGRE